MADFIYQEPFPWGGQKPSTVFDEGLCESRRVRRPQDPQGRPRRPRTLVQSRVQRRVVLPARRAPAEAAQHPRRSRSYRQRQSSWPTPCCSTRSLRPRANFPHARIPARPSASAIRARTSIRAPTTPRASRKAFTKPTRAQPRYSQVVPFTMTDEKNSGHQPAGPDRHLRRPSGHGIRIPLHHQSGRRLGNKTFLTSRPKALLNEESLTKFIKQHIFDLGTSARPPYHPPRSASAARRPKCAFDREEGFRPATSTSCPLPGNEGRPLLPRPRMGGRRCSRSVRRAASARVRRQVPRTRRARDPRPASCGFVPRGHRRQLLLADRNIKAKITPDGIFLEALEKNPARFLPARGARHVARRGHRPRRRHGQGPRNPPNIRSRRA